MHLGLRADKEGRTAALRVIGGFACNEGFVFSLFYLGENRAFGDGPFAFERADLWGTLACMLIAFALLRMASPRARDALLSRPLVWCYAGLLVLGSLMPAIAGGGDHGIVLESLLVGLPAGWALHRFIMQNIRISLVSFHIHVTPLSYALAFAATLLLAVAVCLCLIRKIDRISMAESLKSIE